MTTPPRSPLAPPGEPPITSARHVFDTVVADELIRAMRATLPDDPDSDDRLRAAVVEYVDAARARGETHERMLTAVRHTVTALVTSAAWSGINRPAARNLIEVNVALASARFYVEDAFRDAQPSTAFHFEVRSDGAAPSPKTSLQWSDEQRDDKRDDKRDDQRDDKRDDQRDDKRDDQRDDQRDDKREDQR